MAALMFEPNTDRSELGAKQRMCRNADIHKCRTTSTNNTAASAQSLMQRIQLLRPQKARTERKAPLSSPPREQPKNRICPPQQRRVWTRGSPARRPLARNQSNDDDANTITHSMIGPVWKFRSAALVASAVWSFGPFCLHLRATVGYHR